jgi:uncharacterized protein YkwD
MCHLGDAWGRSSGDRNTAHVSVYVYRKAIEGRALRYIGAVVAVLAVLIAGVTSVAGEGSASEPYDSEEVEFLHLLNHYREENGAGPLLLSDTLAVAAEHHSQDMAHYNFFGHTTAASSHYAVGSQPWDRMRAEGYDYNTRMAENIAVGCESAERCFELWRNSPSHNAAMLDGRYEVIGIARVNAGGSAHGWYWTTDFGAWVDPTSHPPGQSAPPPDGPSIENGQMSGKRVWQQKATDDAQLILKENGEGYARLGDYDNGRDELWQKIRVGENSDLLSYQVKIETNEHLRQQVVAGDPSDYLKVRLVDAQGEPLEVLTRYTEADAGGGWINERIDLPSRFEGRTVYLSFLVKTDELLTTVFYLDGLALHNNEE